MSFNSNKDYYFGSYSHFNIHEEMLKDKARTDAYKNSIEKNAHLFEGKTVLDIGTGTGILSLFAVKYGKAKKVYAVDNADIAYFAKDIINQAGYSDKIQVIKGKIEDVEEIKAGSIDIIISEWMGYFLLYESMLDSIISVRDKYLKKGGTIWPNQAQIFVAALEDERFYKEKVGHWKNVYGFNMSSMQNAVLREAQIDFVSPLNIVSSHCKVLDLNLNTMKKGDVDFSSTYSLRIIRNDNIHGLVSWFDCIFEDPKHPEKRVVLSTSPGKLGTHWKQTTFYMDLKNSMNQPVKRDDILCGSIACV